jgi:hypothetical protein
MTIDLNAPEAAAPTESVEAPAPDAGENEKDNKPPE